MKQENKRGIVHLQGSWILFVLGLALFVLYFGLLISGPAQQQNNQIIPLEVDARVHQEFLIDLLFSPVQDSEDSPAVSLYSVLEQLLLESRDEQLLSISLIQNSFDGLFGQFAWALQICGQRDDTLGLATVDCQAVCFEETNTEQGESCFLSVNREGEFASRSVLEYQNQQGVYRELTVLRR